MARFLSDTLRAWATTPFVWGQTDCASSIIAHVERATGAPLLEKPIWANKREAARLMRDFHGWADMVLTQGGLKRVGKPEAGDIILTDLPGSGLIIGLVTARGWAFKGPKGVACVSALSGPVIGAWRIACRS